MNTKIRVLKASLVALVATGGCNIFGGGSDEKTGAVVPAQGGTTATGGSGQTGGVPAAGGTARTGGTGGATQVDSGGAGATASCASSAGPPMIDVPGPNGAKFCVDRTEVTQGQYAEFLKAATSKAGSEHPDCGSNASYAPKLGAGGGPSWEPGGTECVDGVAWTPEKTPNRPVACIDWCDAYAFCAWAGKRLCGKMGGGPGTASTTALDPNDFALNPASSQWYTTCSQGGKTLYPYGDSYNKDACEGFESSKDGGGKQDVGTQPECRGTSEPYVSIVDLSGSVMEFTDECTLDTTSPGPVVVCAARGGGYSSQGTGLDCKHYGTFAREAYRQYVGFRCCKDLP